MVINVRIHRMMIMVIGSTFFILVMILLLFKFVFTGSNSSGPEPAPDDQMYGEFLPWKEVNKLFPRGSNAMVVDIDSGIAFWVQRRAGSSHADAQPLTAADSAAMKQAYNGRWSWKRRAVLVILPDGRKIAASMAGMPHGQGAIPDNNFDGHFCIHFRDSRTHGSGKVDLAHQMMVWKASNTITQHIGALDREGVIALFFTALDQREYNIISQLMHPDIDINPLLLQMQRIERVKYDNIRALPGNDYSVEVRIIFLDSNREVGHKISLTVCGEGPPWRIIASSLIPLLKPEPTTAIFEFDSSWYSQEDWEQC
ncbi:MAG: hypothetical protein ABRQ24_02255 [Syntrophomonadaceae bacterium]